MNEKPLFHLTEVAAPQGLLERVIATIQHKQRMARLWRMRISVGAGIASVAALVPVGISLANSFAVSHFADYVSLLGDSAALTYWKEISVSILESLPAALITMAIALVGVALWSMRTAIRSMGSTARAITNFA
jgi:hypothetical protein